jgi:hypothetical protein
MASSRLSSTSLQTSKAPAQKNVESVESRAASSSRSGSTSLLASKVSLPEGWTNWEMPKAQEPLSASRLARVRPLCSSLRASNYNQFRNVSGCPYAAFSQLAPLHHPHPARAVLVPLRPELVSPNSRLVRKTKNRVAIAKNHEKTGFGSSAGRTLRYDAAAYGYN